MQDNLSQYINYEVINGPVGFVKIQALHGANFFSAAQVIYLRVNLGIYDEVYSNEIVGLLEFLKIKLPKLFDHFCSPGIPGGFFKRVEAGTLLGHVIEHIAIEFQTRAGMDVGYGKTRSTLEKGTYNIIFRFFDEVAGIYAGKAALNMINAFLLKQDFNTDEIIQNLIDIREKRLLGPSTQAIVHEVEKRKIPYQRLDAYNLVQLGTGKYQKRIRATITSDTSFIAVETAGNKHLTNLILKDAGVPVLDTTLVQSVDEAISFSKSLEKEIVIKPSEGYQGKYISTRLSTAQEIVDAFSLCATHDQAVLVQEYRKGFSYRILVINNKFVAASLLTPPFIVGNGIDSIANLIDKLNQMPERQIGDKGKLSKVEIDDITTQILKENNYTLDTILKPEEKLFLKYSGNLKLGGSATDVTDIVHPVNKFLAERAAIAIGLNVAGIDIISQDISSSMFDNGAAVLEVNAAPDFRMHLNPTFNKPRNVAKELVDVLFPLNSKNRVPVFSVTGTTGKTTTAFLLNYCLRNESLKVGLTTTEGLYITDNRLMQGDMTYPEDVSLVFKDPTIDCAVLETSLEGILRRGLGYKFADFGIVLNVMEDHIGNDDVEFIDDIAYAKSVVAEEVFTGGYSVLNADIPFVAEMTERLYSKPALFSVDRKNNKLIQKHIIQGGLAVTLEDGSVKVFYNNQSYELLPVSEIPLFFGGKALFMSDTILATAASLTAFGIHPDKIRKHLSGFKPNYANLPGRMNLFENINYSILLDYAHNKPSFNALATFLFNFSNYKIGIFDAPGDRSDEELITLGKIAAGMFNEVVLYEGEDNRGRKNGDVSNCLYKGLTNEGFDTSKIHIKPCLDEALQTITQFAINNNFIVLLTGQCDICHSFLSKKNLV